MNLHIINELNQVLKIIFSITHLKNINPITLLKMMVKMVNISKKNCLIH